MRVVLLPDVSSASSRRVLAKGYHGGQPPHHVALKLAAIERYETLVIVFISQTGLAWRLVIWTWSADVQRGSPLV